MFNCPVSPKIVELKKAADQEDYRAVRLVDAQSFTARTLQNAVLSSEVRG